MRNFIFFFLVFCHCQLSISEIKRTQLLMGDVLVSITIKTNQTDKAFKMMSETFKLASTLESVFSDFKSKSDVSLLNQNAGIQPTKVDKKLFDLIILSKEISEKTDGFFDITFNSDLGFNYKNIIIDNKNKKIFLPNSHLKIGLGAIAKGYIIEAMKKNLVANGFDHFIINAGGDLTMKGIWPIDIQVPYDEKKSFCSFKLRDSSIATSGTYARGKHIINPLTHKPVSTYKSVTVIYKDATIADAVATAVFAGWNPVNAVSVFKNIRLVILDNQNQTKIWGDVKCVTNLNTSS